MVWAVASRHHSVFRNHRRRPDSEQARELPPALLAAVAPQDLSKENGVHRPETREERRLRGAEWKGPVNTSVKHAPTLVVPTPPTGLGLNTNRRTSRFGSWHKARFLRDALWHISVVTRFPAPPMGPETKQVLEGKAIPGPVNKIPGALSHPCPSHHHIFISTVTVCSFNSSWKAPNSLFVQALRKAAQT